MSAAIVACVLTQVSARAQALDDPMRPPSTAASAAAPNAGNAQAQGGLQAVITSPGRKLAVIDGAIVPLGAPVRDATLSGLSDSVAVLKKKDEREVLLMYPDIEKRPARRAAP